MAAFGGAEVEAARGGHGWWSMAENPPCVETCLVEHDPHEFMVTGELVCSRPFGDVVTAIWLQVASLEIPFLVETDADVAIEIDASRSSTASDAERVVEQIQAALAFVRA